MFVLNSKPILFSIHGLDIYTHGVFFALGALVGAVIFARQLRRSHKEYPAVFADAAWIFLIGLLTARAGFFISYPSSWSGWNDALQIWQGGLVSYWGMLGGLLTAAWLFRRLPGRTGIYWDALALASLLGWAIGRIGNYYAADTVGILSTPWEAFYGRIPIQLFESLWCLILFIVLWYRTPRLQKGRVLLWAIFGYHLGRLVIDTWRDEDVLILLHASQWVALAVVIISGILLWTGRKAGRSMA